MFIETRRVPDDILFVHQPPDNVGDPLCLDILHHASLDESVVRGSIDHTVEIHHRELLGKVSERA
ncbi:MAG: hypothetical protein C4326_02705 [Ignavibacteria bacterium]